jgi:LacI family transcriptional regulator, repressor for deo operon, udp, cdd, tsx, nupC, and nupG
MEDVAERAGVSVSTVSRALRGSPLVSPETTERVLAAAQALSFAVSRAASSLATGKLNRIAVLVSGSLGTWFNGTLLDAVYETLHQAGQELLIYRTLDTRQRDEFFATLPARRNADALIVASLALEITQHRRLSELGMPLVCVNQRLRGASSVAVDDAAGAAAATRHLLELGHRRIAFVAAVHAVGSRPSSADRVSGYREAMGENSRAGRERVILVAPGDDPAAILDPSLHRARRPTGLVVESDELAMRLLAGLYRMGVRIPEELSVIGFDDHASAATFGLSTMAQPVDVLGREAALCALRLVGASRPRTTQLVLPTELVRRDTTGPPPG